MNPHKKTIEDDCIGEVPSQRYLDYQDGIREVWDEIICPMCYRLNPQHATMDNGEGCHWCQEKEDWCGKPN